MIVKAVAVLIKILLPWVNLEEDAKSYQLLHKTINKSNVKIYVSFD